MSDSKPDIKAMVEARVAEEAASAPPAEQKNTRLPLDFVIQCLWHSRMGDAQLFEALNRGRFIYVKNWGRWLYWKGHHWLDDIENIRAKTAVTTVCTEYERILAESDEEPGSVLMKEVRKRLNLLRDTPARERVLEATLQLTDHPMYIEDGEQLDCQEYLLATPNGVVDLRTGILSDGKPEQYLLNSCPTEWKGLDEPSPAFDQFLSSSFDGDEVMVRYMLRLLGYGLLGYRGEGVWAIFHGPRGRNGKDTLMKVIRRHLGGKLSIKVPTALLLQQSFQRSGSQPEPDIMALRGAKFAFASEGESNQRIAMAKIKDLTGDSAITARGLQDKLMTTWNQTHLLFFLTNELPRMKADDDAFWSRLHAVHWPIRFVDKPSAPDERPRDPKMYTKLCEEGPGILARLVEGCMDFLAQGLAPPEKVTAYTAEQREQFDEIGVFLQDCCLLEEPPGDGYEWEYETAVSRFVAVLNWWCKKSLGWSGGFSPKKVIQTLEKRGFPSKKSNVMFYKGVAIKDETAQEYAAFLEEEEKKKSGRRS